MKSCFKKREVLNMFWTNKVVKGDKYLEIEMLVFLKYSIPNLPEMENMRMDFARVKRMGWDWMNVFGKILCKKTNVRMEY